MEFWSTDGDENDYDNVSRNSSYKDDDNNAKYNNNNNNNNHAQVSFKRLSPQ
jgi:hypothetical protein